MNAATFKDIANEAYGHVFVICLTLCLIQFKNFQLNQGTNGGTVTMHLSTLCTFKQNSNYGTSR